MDSIEQPAATGYEFSFQVFDVTAEEAEALFDATATFVHGRADQIFGIGPSPLADEGAKPDGTITVLRCDKCGRMVAPDGRPLVEGDPDCGGTMTMRKVVRGV